MSLKRVRLAKSAASDTVYVGYIDEEDQSWIDKKDITNEFITAVIEMYNGYRTEVTDRKGKRFEITVREVDLPEDK